VSSLNNTRLRLERLADERQRTNEKIEDLISLAEEEQRDLVEHESQQIDRYRNRLGEMEEEIAGYAADLERAEASGREALRRREPKPAAPEPNGGNGGDGLYRTYAQYARDELIVRYPLIASAAGGQAMGAVERAQERLEHHRAIANTLSSTVAGLILPNHITQIMDLINNNRPVAVKVYRLGGEMHPRIQQIRELRR
jgi:HK97 family phage major capsid protein